MKPKNSFLKILSNVVSRPCRASTVLLLLFTVYCLLSTALYAEPPNLLTYQGRLKESGQPVTGTRNVEIKLCDAETAGNCYTTNDQPVSVSNGLFRSTFTVPSGINLNTGNWYLELVINGTTYTPREKFTSSIYSLYSASASYANNLAPASGSSGIFASSSIFVTQGNVGIGTTNPVQKLQVVGTISSDGNLTAGGTWGGQSGGLRLYRSDDVLGSFITSAGDSYITGGNVGIGTTNPTHKLRVEGNMLVTSSITANAWMTGGCTNPNDSNDIMVAVGPWCVDKYEASVWSTPTGGTEYGSASDDYLCNDNGQDCGAGAANPVYARSVSGVTPSRYLTWFQANMACFNAGKELLPNHVWQAAAAGTTDPGATGTAPNCNVSGSGPTTTGSGTNCLSTAGAENMIGSLWEWVADWGTAGAGASNTEGTFIEFDGTDTGYNNDWNWNVGGKAYTIAPNPAGWITGLILAAHRGGYWADGAGAGVFAFYATDAPSAWGNSIGFRCGRRR